ncbi:MAG: Lrp/AsnC family transcriptional regulator [Promethearchaeota archaeon]
MENHSEIQKFKNIREIQAIVKGLNKRSKIKFIDVAKSLNVSRHTFHKKLKSLIQENIINKFTINIHPYIQPFNLRFMIVEIKTNPKEPRLVQELLKIHQLKSLDGIFGEFSLIAILVFKSNSDYYNTLRKIDLIMAKSYFKKYQILEPIKIFKINGITLRKIPINKNNIMIDEIDRMILDILEYNQGTNPISTYEIKDMIKIKFKRQVSQPTIYNRIRAMEENGIILNYALNFNPRKIGYRGKFIVRIKPKDPSKYEELAYVLEEKEEIIDLFRIGEQFGLFAIVRVKEIEDYGTFIKKLYEEDIEDTFTNFVLDEIVSFTNFVLF